MNTPENDPTQPTRLTPISQAATYAEIGEFWDIHSGADYWDQMVEVEMTIDPAVRRKFRDGISEASLSRVWENDQDAVYDNWRDLYGVSK